MSVVVGRPATLCAASRPPTGADVHQHPDLAGLELLDVRSGVGPKAAQREAQSGQNRPSSATSTDLNSQELAMGIDLGTSCETAARPALSAGRSTAS